MLLSELPNTLTDYDKEQISLLSKTLNFSNRVYPVGQLANIYVKEITGENKGTVEVQVFSISATSDLSDGCYQSEVFEDVNLLDLNYLPTNEQFFASYKEELKVIPFLVNEEINKDELLKEYLAEITTDPELYVRMYSEGDCLLLCPTTHTYAVYKPNGVHPFEVDVQGETYYFDSLDLALKAPYEWAMDECGFKPDSLRNRLSILEEYMDSEEGKKSVQEFWENIDKENKEAENFCQSERFNELIPILKEKLKTLGVIDDFLFDHQGGVDFMTENEFYSIMKGLFRLEEVEEDEDAVFTTTFVKKYGLLFTKMYGQGTACTITLIED